MRDLISGKNVIIVAPAPTLTGLGLGKEIDKFDVIVRFHNSWHIIAPEDHGSRTDILYVNGFHAAIKKKELYAGLKENAFKFIKKDYRIKLATDSRIIDYYPDISKKYNIGLNAVIDLLSYNIKSLTLSGYSFYKTAQAYADKDYHFGKFTPENHLKQELQIQEFNYLLNSDKRLKLFSDCAKYFKVDNIDAVEYESIRRCRDCKLPRTACQTCECKNETLKPKTNEITKSKQPPGLEDIKAFMDNKTICIVGNADSVKDKEYGEIIDRHDIVIRFNDGIPPAELHKHAGRRTDIWACCITKFRTDADGKKYIDNNYFNYIYELRNKAFDIKYILWLATYNKSYVPTGIDDITYVQDGQNIKELQKEINAPPSSGAMMIHFIKKHIQYKKISMAGFDFFETKEWYRNVKNTGKHNFESECEYIRQQKDIDIIGYNHYKDKKIALCFLCDKDFLPGLEQLYKSIELYNDVSTYDKVLISDDIESYKDFILLKPDKVKYENIPFTQARFIKTFYKLELFKLKYDRVIIFDCDIICKGSLNYLFSDDLNDYDICAAKDEGTKECVIYKDNHPRINGGVMVVNKSILKKSNFNLAIKISEAGLSYDGGDQGTINEMIFQENYRYKILPMEYNTLGRVYTHKPETWEKIKHNIKLLHYCGYDKPWLNAGKEYKDIYHLWQNI